MDSLNAALPPVRRESEERRDPLDIFREFLDHVGRAANRRPDSTSQSQGRDNTR